MKVFYHSLINVSVYVLSFVPGIGYGQYIDKEVLNNPSTPIQWPEGKRMAISLTFDDARLSQIDKGIPLLNNYNFRVSMHLKIILCKAVFLFEIEPQV